MQNADPPVTPVTLTAKEKRRAYNRAHYEKHGPRLSRKQAEAAAAAQVKREKRMGPPTPIAVVHALQQRLESSQNDVIDMNPCPARDALLSMVHGALSTTRGLYEALKAAPIESHNSAYARWALSIGYWPF
jgi:hypothetical protein